MSSSSAQPESKRAPAKFRGVLLLLVVLAYPAVAWWTFAHGGKVGATALWVAALPQVFCYVGLLWLFGRSLIGAREAILTRFARFVHGDISTEIARYTRQITVFWSLFFAAMAITSVSLLVFVSSGAWLFFANVLNLPLLVCAFLAEYAYRSMRFPGAMYPSLAATVTAFRQFRDTREDS
jgi:uncharacterized membrane protein